MSSPDDGRAQPLASPLSDLVALMPFAGELGVVLDAASPDEVSGRMEWTAERCTAGGILHGGALMAFADTLGGVCAFLTVPPGAGTATIGSSTNLLRCVQAGSVRGVARRLHAGRTVIVVQTELRDDDGRSVAYTTQTQTIVPGAVAASTSR